MLFIYVPSTYYGAVAPLRRWVVPNIGRQLILERCIHGVAEQFQSRIRPEGNGALHNQPLLVVHDDLQALELVAIHGPHAAKVARPGGLRDGLRGVIEQPWRRRGWVKQPHYNPRMGMYVDGAHVEMGRTSRSFPSRTAA